MVRLRDIPRTAAFAWSPGPSKPLVVTGTRAGAVSDDFSDETKLELWDLNLDNQNQGLELQPIASIDTDSRFHDIAWGPPDADHPQGIIAGALDNGSVDLWDAEKLISGSQDALIARTTKHSGPIKSLQFNPQRPQILATAGAKSELFIYDINDISNPFRLGNPAARPEDLECIAWNRKVAHILATGGTGGFVTVWDLKTKKASLTLNNNRKAISAIAWDPNNSTKLLTATPDDNTPVILLWDLRNSNAPERTLQGHEQGVLSLSWCQQDSELLISSGKDNKTIVWNPQTGEKYGELPEVTNWTFQTRFHPHNPNLSATASFDGKIAIQTLQSTNPDTTQVSAQSSLDDDDFFKNVQSQPQVASFSLAKAPKWFERPIGASFGFGGKLIIYKPASGKASKIEILPFSVDSDISTATEKFEEALKSGDVKSICDSHRENATTEEEKADWLVMGTLVAEDQRRQIVEYLGCSQDEGDGTPSEEESTTKETPEASETKDTTDVKKNRLSNIWGDSSDADEEFPSNFASGTGDETGTPFFLISDDSPPVDQQISKALMLGNFQKATEVCLKEDRMADAFMIANCGGKELVEKVQTAYLAKKEGNPSYLRLLGSVITKNLKDVVRNVDLSNWKEAMATICTFATPTEFPDLCEALGDRVFESGSRKDASFCYLVGSKLTKVVPIWITELEEAEQAGTQEANEDSSFSVHARSLQHFIEKVTIFRHVTKFDDTEKSLSEGWKLEALYDKYIEYADIVAAHGLLSIAQKYLDLLPATYPAAELSRNRVRLATQSATPKQGTRNVVPARSAQRQPPVTGYQPVSTSTPTGPANPYQPAQPQLQQFTHPVGGNPYQPPAPMPAPSNPYAPPTTAFTPAHPVVTGPPIGGPPLGGPPRSGTPSASIKKDVGNWNDVPIVAKVPSRRTTPSVAPITYPFPNQQPASVPPPTNPYQRAAPTPPPPPPKGSAPPRMTSPPTGASPGMPPPRPSSAANAYAPPPQTQPAGHIPPAMPRVASPYNAPPAGQPPTNRYAPAPAPQQPNPQPSMAPSATRPPPANPYAAQPPPAASQGPYAPSPYGQSQTQTPVGPPPSNITAPPMAGPPMAGPPMSGPPMGGPPMGGPPRAGPPPPGGARATPPPPRATAAAPPKAQHPPGDRSHIPPNAQPIVDILTRDMARVSRQAPESFSNMVKDTEKRLNILFDHLNNEDLIKPDTVNELVNLSQAIESRDYKAAHDLQVKIQSTKTDECGTWMVGVKRLISMSKSTP